MKLLVSGGAGFIGSHLCEKLAENHKVVCIDNLSLGKKSNINHIKDNFTFMQCEILNPKELELLFRTHHFDAIFHLAANSDISKGDPKINFQDTFMTTLVLLEKCRIFNIKQFVFASSGAVYGEITERVDEDSGPLLPISHYAAAKLSSEAFISSYSAMYNIQAFIYRLPSVIGERATHGVAFDFINKLLKVPEFLNVLGDGKQTKPYMYVKDLVDAMIFIWQNANKRVNYYNIRGKGRTSIKEIAEIVVKEMGVKTKIIYEDKEKGWAGDVTQYDCSSDKLESLGYECKLSSTGAVKLAIKNMLK